MKYVEVGGVKLSAIGLGTWQFGSSEWGYGQDYAAIEARKILLRAVELGVNLVDTAEIYGFGKSEKIIGEALMEGDLRSSVANQNGSGESSNEDLRSKVFIATKVFPIAPLQPVVEQRARASAKRLQTDVLDLYQVHWPNPVVPLSTTMAGMRNLVNSGLVKHVGVSNFSAARWKQADDLLGSAVLTNQVRFNLVDRRPESEVLPFAQKNDRIVIAYSPLAQGFLSAKYSSANRPRGAARAGNPLFLPENLDRGATLFEVLQRVASAHDATPSQVSLAWLISKPNVVVIPGASSVEQLEKNVEAANLELTSDELASLDEVSDAFMPTTGPRALPKLALARFGVKLGR